MQDLKKLNEQIIAYLSGELEGRDKAFIENWIAESQENRDHFHDVRHNWWLVNTHEQLKNVNVDEEWNRFRIISGINKKKEQQETMDLPEFVVPLYKRPLFRVLILVAAACIVIAVGLVAGWFDTGSSRSSLQTVTQNKTIDSQSLPWREINHSGKTRSIKLPDGSSVDLYDKSELEYVNETGSGKRKVKLTGKAYLKVTKDSLKPFIVTGGDLAVTVLGTEFLVSAIADDPAVSVQLFEGKVSVNSSESAKQKLPRTFFLKPGQQLFYDTKNATASISSFKNAKRKFANTDKRSEQDQLMLSTNREGSWYMFNNQQLSQVFDQLEEMFDVDIIYSKSEVSRMYFIGSFKKTDSIGAIVNRIVQLNNLKVTTKGNQLFITKAEK